MHRLLSHISRTFLLPLAFLLLVPFSYLAIANPSNALATGDINSRTCSPETESSPGFRSFLPDCRAYELVSPPFGAGQPAFGVAHRTPLISADGEHVVGVSFGGFCGTEHLEEAGLEYGAIYEFSRTPAGWGCEALDPPTSEYPRSELLFPSADLSRSLWKVQVPGRGGEEFVIPEREYDGWDLAVRDAAGGGNGRFSVLGPVVAPGHESNHAARAFAVVGASADLSRVFLAVGAEHKQLWPGDMTVAPEPHPPEQLVASSLYEYRGGGGGEPVLVGVRNSGPLDGRPNVNDGADLISQCGIGYDAASASGEAVYFTADAADHGPEGKYCNELGEGTGPPVNELYARVDGSRTVKISGAGAAEFRGASEDGSKVFFTEGGTLYVYDLDAPEGQRVSVVASGVGGVAAISKDGSRVYFTSPAELTSKANANGETAGEVAGEKLYWCDTGAGSEPVFVAGEPGTTETTSDGRYVAFSSTRRLKGTNDTSTVQQLFEYDTETEAVVRVSVGQKSPGGFECPATKAFQEGFNCDGNTESGEELPKFTSGSEGGPAAGTSGLSLADTGVVVFSSPLALTPLALPGQPQLLAGAVVGHTENLYEYRAGDVYLISPADEASPLTAPAGESRLLGVDASGRDVFFATTDSLVPQDSDTQSSWYDAREEGGFPAPAAPAGCQGEACQGPVPSPPSAASPLAAPGTNENFVPTKKSVAPKPATKKTLKKQTSPTCKSTKSSRTSKPSRTCKSKAKPKSKARKARNYRRTGR